MQDRAPQASIVIPAYNAGAFLGDTIRSVLAQSLANWELVVVDDGSMDETARIAESFTTDTERIRVIRQSNQGVSAARNNGLERISKGSRTVLFLDADDVLEPDALAVLADALSAAPDAIGAHGLAHSIDGFGRSRGNDWMERWGRDRRAVDRDGTRQLTPQEPTDLATLAYRNIIISTHVLLRTARLPAGPLFDPARAYSEDYHLWLTLAREASFVYVDRVTLKYREHAANVSRRRRMLDLGDVEARRGVAEDPSTTDEQRRLLCRGYSLFERDNSRTRTRAALSDLRSANLRSGLTNGYRAARSYLASRGRLCAACGRA